MKVALAFSGGVDSSVSALLLKKKSYEVTAVYIRFWARNNSEKQRILKEEQEAQKIAKDIGIKFECLDFAELHKKEVVDYFISNYKDGYSPNPCIACNFQIKFGKFFDWAMKNNFDLVASGHYAQIINLKDEYFLKRGIDPHKDQSYFLYQLKQEILSKTMFPIGSLEKTEVRKLAKENNLSIHNKKDSFDLCFLNKTTTQNFIEGNIGKKKGNIIDQSGNIIGTHQGIWFYTIGQRQGLRIDHKKLKKSQIEFKKEEAPALFVIAKNKDKNELIVGHKNDCFTTELRIKEVKIINHKIKEIIDKGIELEVGVKIRNTGKLISAKLKKVDNNYQVNFLEKVFAVAPGQSAVFYKKDIVFGGGIITA